MKSILIQLDDDTLAELDTVAPARNRARSEFIRKAIKDALHRNEFDRMRDAYLAQPDTDTFADDWSTASEWNPNPEPTTK